MPSDPLLRKRQAECEGCGAPIPIPLTENITVIECKHCGSLYEYDPTIPVMPKLVFERADRSPFEYELSGSIIIGRECDYGYVKIRSEIDESIEENTYVRNPFISKEHARIMVKKEYDFLSEGDTKKIVVKKKCFVEDLESRFGTTVNNVLLKPTELKEVKHNDKIVLAATSDLPILVIFKEEIDKG